MNRIKNGRLIYGFLVLQIISGCNYSNKSQYSLKGSEDFITLNTKGNTNPKTPYIYYHQEYMNDWLIYGNPGKNEVILYSFPDGELVKRIGYEERGPNGVGSVRGVYVHNFDTIFTISETFYNSFFITDTTGEVKNRYELEKTDDRPYPPAIIPLFTHINQELYFENEIINLGSYKFTESSNEDLYKEIISVDFNLGKQKIVNEYYFPKFSGNFKSDISGYSRTFNGENFVYSFGRIEDLYIQDSSGNFIIKDSKSRFQKKNLDWINNPTDPIIKQRSNSVKNPRYLSIIYDKYRNCYYRFFKPGYNIKKSEDLELFSDYPYQFSIIILDESFNVKGETLMLPEKYDPFMFFIAQDGLYIALHCNHPEYNPDSLTFERFDLEES